MPPKTKANPRKAELKDALDKSTEKSGQIPAVLQDASTAMGSDAWTGGTSGDFSSGLTEQSTTAKKGGTATVEEISSAYESCPDTVPDPSAQEPK